MATHQDGDIILSVVIPLLNEEGNVEALLTRLLPVLRGLAVPYEIVLVDDGSRDQTWDAIRRCAVNIPEIKGLALSRNFGHQHALLAGLTHARGAAIVSMDGDLQHPPEVIPELLTAWRQGYKVVNAIRQDQGVNSTFKRLTSKYFYWIFSKLADVHIAEGSSDFRLIDRQVQEQLERFNDVDLFLRGAVQYIGLPSTTVHFALDNRFAGRSKYNLRRMGKLAAGAVVSFSTKPLRIGIWLGVLMSGLAFVELIYVLVRYLQGATVSGWASIMGVLSLLFGMLFVMLGIIGTYLASIHRALQDRPRFIVKEMLNIDQNR
ncbi:MAG: glycosyltransferase family 2 protein [Gammaproteobacteria bacterium]